MNFTDNLKLNFVESSLSEEEYINIKDSFNKSTNSELPKELSAIHSFLIAKGFIFSDFLPVGFVNYRAIYYMPIDSIRRYLKIELWNNIVANGVLIKYKLSISVIKFSLKTQNYTLIHFDRVDSLEMCLNESFKLLGNSLEGNLELTAPVEKHIEISASPKTIEEEATPSPDTIKTAENLNIATTVTERPLNYPEVANVPTKPQEKKEIKYKERRSGQFSFF